MNIQSIADIITTLVGNYTSEIKVVFIFAMCIGLIIAAYTEEL